MKIIWTAITVAYMGFAARADEPAKKPDVSCELTGSYTGNAMSPYFKLKLGPPGKPDWTYASSDDMFGRLKDQRVTEYRGTYMIDGEFPADLYDAIWGVTTYGSPEEARSAAKAALENGAQSRD